MEYIKNTDYDYIMNKYHDQSKIADSFDPVHRGANIFNRFIRRDEIFDESTGMHGDDIIEGIRRQDEELKSLPHPVRKARAFEYVLKNTRISCDGRDIFPAINMVDRPLNKTLIADWKQEVFGTIIPGVEKKRAYLEDNGIVTIWPDYDHSVPVWERIFELGFSGILKASEEMRAKRENITEAESAFFDGIKITYTAIIEFTDRLLKQAEKQGSLKMAKALGSIKNGAPKSFYEALLADYLYFMLCEHVEGLQVRSLSNFDRLFYRFCTNDLASGVSEHEIRTDLAYFLLQFMAIGNYWGQPVYLGGCKEDESTVINELSYIFLDVYDKMGIYNPKIQIKVADSTPKDFILKALDMIRRGNNSIVFISDATIRKSLMNAGATANGSIMTFGFMADIADSLANIKKYVFDSGLLSLVELRDTLDSDFKGNEKLRMQLLSDRDKYGNNKDLPDYFAKDISEFVCSKVCGRPNTKKRGGKWNLGYHVARQSYSQAPFTASSPNGRLKGEELSKNLSASMGMNRDGATAAILSISGFADKSLRLECTL